MTSALKDNGSTGKWRKIRARILQRDGYTCQACGMDGNHVDHIVPRNLFGEGNADHDDNLQTLCKSCNLRKGGRFFNHHVTPLTLPCFAPPQNDSNGLEKPPQGSVRHDHD